MDLTYPMSYDDVEELKKLRAEKWQSNTPNKSSFTLEHYELEILYDWHNEQKWHYADKEEYEYADQHKKRAKQIRNYLTETSRPLER